MTVFIEYLILVSVIFLMLGVGMSTPFGQILAVGKEFRALMLGLAANFVVVPALFWFGLQWLPVLPHVNVAIVVMASAPVAPMAPAFVGLARGDVPYSVGLMVLSAILCVALTPLILAVCLPAGPGSIRVDTLGIVRILLTAQLIPLCSGMALRHALPDLTTEKLLRPVSNIGQIGLVVSVLLTLVVGAGQIVDLGLVAHLVIALAVLMSLFVGDRMLQMESARMRRSLGISTAIRNVALALLIVTTNFKGTPAVPAVLVFGILSLVVGAVYGRATAGAQVSGS
jgi:BASS family bile acid:Na+ symporter